MKGKRKRRQKKGGVVGKEEIKKGKGERKRTRKQHVVR